MKHWIIVSIAIGLFVMHERLSASKYWFLGGLLPLLGAGAAIYQFLFAKILPITQNIIAYVVFFAVTLLLWIAGRYERKQKELRKMNAQDIQ